MNIFILFIALLFLVLMIVIIQLFNKIKKIESEKFQFQHSLNAQSFSIQNYERIKNELEFFNAQKEQKIKSLEQKQNLLEAEALKYQLQPHTLRNLFAQMQSLSNKLNKGWESLSLSMEYIFYSGKNHFVTIEEEVDFVKNYLKLNETFIDNFSAVKLNIDDISEAVYNSGKREIPHLISAYLLENAFKHGDKTYPEFLKVKIIANYSVFEIHVINKIRPVYAKSKTKGIGLENMKKRLDLFVSDRWEYTSSCNEEEYHAKLKIKL